MPAEKLQIILMEKFSCSKCDMDFDLEEALKKHSENCEIALLEPGEVQCDHTYSKSVFQLQILQKICLVQMGPYR
jgi:hypothetical protein